MMDKVEKASDRSCQVCGHRLAKDGLGFFVVPPQIEDIHTSLKNIGLDKLASELIEATESTYEAFCTKCWVGRYLYKIMTSSSMSDRVKIEAANFHIGTTLQSTGWDGFFKAVGRPDLN